MIPRPVLIDTDTGVDDALALVLALRSPEIRVVGITTVAGNVEVHRCTRNVHEVIRRLRIVPSPPVVSGASRPLRLSLVTAPEVHGAGGLGTVTAKTAPALRTDPLEAARFVARQAGAYGRRLTIVALGPLTNIAHAFRLFPVQMRSVGRIISMGGAFTVPGNTGPVAEFNYYVDPHAVRQVTMAAQRLLVVPLDVTEQQTLMWDEMVRRTSRPLTRWMRDLLRVYMDYHLATEGFRGAYLHDPIAVAEAIVPGILATRSAAITIATSSGIVRGMTSVSRGRAPFKRHALATEIDASAFRMVFRRVWS